MKHGAAIALTVVSNTLQVLLKLKVDGRTEVAAGVNPLLYLFYHLWN